MEEEGIIFKRSKLRQEIEALLQQKGLVLESRISVTNLDSGEAHYFQSYPLALEFLKGKRGRWYLTTPGIRSIRDHDKG